MCDALIDRQIVHIYHVKFNLVNKNMHIHIYIQLLCIILIDIVVHYDYSISIYICSNLNLRLPKKITAGFHRFSPVFNGSTCRPSVSSVAFPDDDGGGAARGRRLKPAQRVGVRRVDGLDGPAHQQPGRLGALLHRNPPGRRNGPLHGELQKFAALPGAAGGARGRACSA